MLLTNLINRLMERNLPVIYEYNVIKHGFNVRNQVRWNKHGRFGVIIVYDGGDYVIIVNAEKVALTGNKWEDKKYYRHSGFPGGLKELKLEEVIEKNPAVVIREAVKGMLPKNKLAADRLARLRVFDGAEHTHAAQNPKEIK